MRKWPVGAGGDLRRMGDRQDLDRAEPRQPLADGVGDRAADARVDLVEDQRRRRAASASTTFSASMKRASSPPEATFIIGPGRVPGLVCTQNSTRSVPSGPRLRPRLSIWVEESRMFELQRRSSAFTAWSSRVAAFGRRLRQIAPRRRDNSIRPFRAASASRRGASPASIAASSAANFSAERRQSSTGLDTFAPPRARRTAAPRSARIARIESGVASACSRACRPAPAPRAPCRGPALPVRSAAAPGLRAAQPPQRPPTAPRHGEWVPRTSQASRRSPATFSRLLHCGAARGERRLPRPAAAASLDKLGMRRGADSRHRARALGTARFFAEPRLCPPRIRGERGALAASRSLPRPP